MITKLHNLYEKAKKKLHDNCNDAKAIAIAQMVANGILTESDLSDEINNMHNSTKILINEKPLPNVYFTY
jgi:hypothetical protein